MISRLSGPWSAMLAVAALYCSGSAFANPAPTPPDLTVDRQVDRKLTYNLGATGLRGWIHTRAANFLDSAQGRTTTAARQILVTHVGQGSPADGVMRVDDVILGVGGKPFDDDARKQIAAAIQEAEKETNGGRLRLSRWRSGTTEEVTITLPVLGTYTATAPYDCPKSKRILTDAVKALEKEQPRDDLWGAVDGLAMLASGEPALLPRARDIARRMATSAAKLGRRDMGTWESATAACSSANTTCSRRTRRCCPRFARSRCHSPGGRACTARSATGSRN